MFCQDTEHQVLIKIVNPDALFDPLQATVQGQQQAGEEEQPVQEYAKARLVFPSGEPLPQCWVNPDYQLD